MPQEMNNPPGSQSASAPPDGFATMDAYDASLQAEEIEVPEDIVTTTGGDEAPAETEEAPAETEEAAPESEEQLFEIDGQQYTGDEMRLALEEREQAKSVLDEFRELKEQYDGTESEINDLKPYRDLKQFLERNPDIRRKLEAETGAFEELAKSKYSDDPHVAALQRQNEELMRFKREAEVNQASEQIDGIFDSLQKTYPDIVDDEFRMGVLNQVQGAFTGDPRFGIKTLAAAAKTTAYLMSKATEKAAQNGKSAAVRAFKKPGVVRLVPAGKQTDAKPKAKDYRNMSNEQMAAEFVKEVG